VGVASEQQVDFYIVKSNMRFLPSRRLYCYKTVSLLILAFFPKVTFAIRIEPAEESIPEPAEFIIEKADVYKSPKAVTALPLHISDLLSVELQWSIYNATLGDYVKVYIDAALQPVQFERFNLMGNGVNRPIAQCDWFEALPPVFETPLANFKCHIDNVPQQELDFQGTLNGTILFEATLQSRYIGDDVQREFEFKHAGNERVKYSDSIPIAKPEDNDRLLPDTELRRICSWLEDTRECNPEKGRCFACTLLFPQDDKFSQLAVSDHIIRGNATPLRALFQRERRNDKTQSMVGKERYSENYSINSYTMWQNQSDSLPKSFDGSRFQFRIDIVYQAPSIDSPFEGFVGISSFEDSKQQNKTKSFLPSYSAWKKISSRLQHSPLPNSKQFALISSENLPVPASLHAMHHGGQHGGLHGQISTSTSTGREQTSTSTYTKSEQTTTSTSTETGHHGGHQGHLHRLPDLLSSSTSPGGQVSNSTTTGGEQTSTSTYTKSEQTTTSTSTETGHHGGHHGGHQGHLHRLPDLLSSGRQVGNSTTTGGEQTSTSTSTESEQTNTSTSTETEQTAISASLETEQTATFTSTETEETATSASTETEETATSASTETEKTGTSTSAELEQTGTFTSKNRIGQTSSSISGDRIGQSTLAYINERTSAITLTSTSNAREGTSTCDTNTTRSETKVTSSASTPSNICYQQVQATMSNGSMIGQSSNGVFSTMTKEGEHDSSKEHCHLFIATTKSTSAQSTLRTSMTTDITGRFVKETAVASTIGRDTGGSIPFDNQNGTLPTEAFEALKGCTEGTCNKASDTKESTRETAHIFNYYPTCTFHTEDNEIARSKPTGIDAEDIEDGRTVYAMTSTNRVIVPYPPSEESSQTRKDSTQTLLSSPMNDSQLLFDTSVLHTRPYFFAEANSHHCGEDKAKAVTGDNLESNSEILSVQPNSPLSKLGNSAEHESTEKIGDVLSTDSVSGNGQNMPNMVVTRVENTKPQETDSIEPLPSKSHRPLQSTFNPAPDVKSSGIQYSIASKGKPIIWEALSLITILIFRMW